MFRRGRPFVNEVVLITVYVILVFGFLMTAYKTEITLGIHEEVEGLVFLLTAWEYAHSFYYFILHLLSSLM